MLPSATGTASASATNTISGLTPAPHATPVYASNATLPGRSQDSVPADPLRPWPGETFTRMPSPVSPAHSRPLLNFERRFPALFELREPTGRRGSTSSSPRRGSGPTHGIGSGWPMRPTSGTWAGFLYLAIVTCSAARSWAGRWRRSCGRTTCSRRSRWRSGSAGRRAWSITRTRAAVHVDRLRRCDARWRPQELPPRDGERDRPAAWGASTTLFRRM
jgi:hypothetical protein